MYLINKDDTEHTGQVRHVKMFITDKHKKQSKYNRRVCVTGIIRVEDVPGEMLGFLPCWRLLQKTI